MQTSAALKPSGVFDEPRPVCGDTVTAIIPTYQRPFLVRNAILSALGQSYRALEVMLVIDGRDRITREAVATIEDPRLRVLELDAKVGAAEARNIGTELATSEWVAFLDDDDEWLPQKIALQMEAARAMRMRYPVISSRTIVRTPAFEWISPRRAYVPGELMSEYLFCRQRFVDGARYMQTSTLMMRRELMMELPFQKDLKRHQDWDWLLRAASHPGVGFHMLPEPLTVFHVEDRRISLGRGMDWEYSRAWAREMRPSFTPRAYSFFLATECMSRAVKTRAGCAVYAELIWEFLVRGRPTARSLLIIAAFLCIPERCRSMLRERIRRLRSRSQGARSSGPICGLDENCSVILERREDDAGDRAYSEVSDSDAGDCVDGRRSGDRSRGQAFS
jgi:glycosyltransferase involved in cell wall biosynthesis